MTRVISTTAPYEQQNSQLLPTFLQHLVPTLTPRQLRAVLAGQRYYQTHQHGTSATQEQLCAFLKRKQRQWEYAHTSVEWQVNFLGGWHAALLNDPTIQTRPTFGGEEEDENNCFPQAQPMVARATVGREDEEDCHPIQAGKPTVPVLAGQGIAPGSFSHKGGATLLARPMFGPTGGDDETWYRTRRPSFGGEGDGDGEGFAPLDQTRDCLVFGPQDGDDGDWNRCPSFGDGDKQNGGWYRSRLPRYAEPRGGASLLTTPNGYPVLSLPINNLPLMGGDGRRPIWPDDDDGNAHRPYPYTPLVAGSNSILFMHQEVAR